MQKTRVTDLFSIEYPIIQAGMVWCSGWRLASAVSNAGGLGLIGAGSMSPAILKEHIQKCKTATSNPFGVNLPLLYPHVNQQVEVILEENVSIVFTSAGNPTLWTHKLKAAGIKVAHVVSSSKFALKAQYAGVDAIVAEGVEAGGHNGREETTSFCLIPQVVETVSIPVIAAGGIGSGKSMLAAFALGAEGVQVGSRFAISEESSAHDVYKNIVIESVEGSTTLALKQLNPVRLLKNKFYQDILTAESKHASVEELKALLGKGRSKKGIFEGDLEEGELEIGQVAASFSRIQPASEIIQDMVNDYSSALKKLR